MYQQSRCFQIKMLMPIWEKKKRSIIIYVSLYSEHFTLYVSDSCLDFKG